MYLQQCPRDRDSHMKVLGILVVLLRGINIVFWSQGGLGKAPSDVPVKVSLRVECVEI